MKTRSSSFTNEMDNYCSNGHSQKSNKEMGHNKQSSYNENSADNHSRIRTFFKNLIHLARSSSSLSLQAEQKETNIHDNSSSKNLKKFHTTERTVVEESNLKHRFLTVKNKNPELFSDYRESLQIKSLVDFRYRFFIHFFVRCNAT